MREDSYVEKIYCFTCGHLHFPANYIIPGEDDRRIDVAIGMFLIEHPLGLILLDTGCSPKCAIDVEGYWGEETAQWCGLVMDGRDAIDRQLAGIGVDTGDIKHVIISHMHLDHAGGMSLFPEARFYVQSKELICAMWPEKGFDEGYYVYEDFCMTRRFDIRILDGDYDLFGDGSVRIIETGGHSRGHQMVLLKMRSGREILLPCDACFNQTSLDQMLSPGHPIPEPERADKALKKVNDIVKCGAGIIYSHPLLSDWCKYPAPPLFID